MREVAVKPDPETVEAADIIQALDDAVDGLLDWLADWHTPAVCGLTARSQERLEHSLGHLDGFQSWFENHADDGIVNQPSVKRMIELNAAIRRMAAECNEMETPPSEGQYAELMSCVKSFISHAKRLERAFAVAASDLDTLTGVQNRQAMRRALVREHERISRVNGSAIVAIADLDHFKPINDTHGHDAGDHVLSVAAGRLLETMRSYDQLFRYGGEEFVILLSDTEEAIAEMVLERLRTHVSAAPITLPSEEDIKITASFGAAVLKSGEPPEDAIKRADDALYKAKEAGRNRVVFAV